MIGFNQPCVPFPGAVFMTSVVMEEFLPVAFGPPWVRDAENSGWWMDSQKAQELCGLKVMVGMINVWWAKIWANIRFHTNRQHTKLRLASM